MLYNLIFFKKPLKDGLFAMPRNFVFCVNLLQKLYKLEDISFHFVSFRKSVIISNPIE